VAVSLDALEPPRAAVPESAPLLMPDQRLDAHCRVAVARPRMATVAARIAMFGGALALTVYASMQMVKIVSLAEITILQWTAVVLFVVTFAWIALAACAAVVGFFGGSGYCAARRDARPTTRTALLMPVYNEDPVRTGAALWAIGSGLIDAQLAGHFEIFMLSDTNDPETWMREVAAVARLRDSFGCALKIWYRRRHDNAGKKAGNIRDFVMRWGGRYDHMIVLDADSLIAPATLATLVCEMEADPRCGILQTFPRLHAGTTLFARLQQFAGAVYGPIIARGITAWQGDDGT
jgi:membrane glycosyltransferase